MRLYVDKFRERRLKVFAFNPTQGRSFGNHIILRIPHEPLEAGPTGRYIAVVDNDKTHGRTYPGVQLDDPALLRSGGIDPTELDIRFHQQMVYAVGQLMVNRFEHALGRPVRWAWAVRNPSDPLNNRLKIYPHAEAMANAYYDAQNGELRFGYFNASANDVGANLPGQIVYSCLEFDVIAHEICHPLLDSVRPNYTGGYTNAAAGDTSAFLEAFCDLMAIFEHFHFEEAVMETLSRTGGLLHQRQLAADVRSGLAQAEISAEIGASNPLLGIA